MQATILDLRYRMKEIIQALDRNETVEIFYRGKKKGTIFPDERSPGQSMKEHPFFGMTAHVKKSVEEEMADLRKGRYAS